MVAMDSDLLAEKRAAVDKAIRAFVQLQVVEADGPKDAYVMGWSAFAEYTSIDMEKEDCTGNSVIVPDGQAAGMSRGLFMFGADAFSRVN